MDDRTILVLPRCLMIYNKLTRAQALKGPAPDGGLWNGRKVAEYLSELIGQSISRQQGWEYLKQMRMRLRVPRSSHQEADPNEQEAWKKKLKQEVERIQNENPDADVEVWSGAGDAPPPVKMNTELGCNRFSVGCGWNKENSRLLQSTGSVRLCGCMRLSNPRQARLTGGF